MDIQHLPVIDWELATKMAGNKREIAEEIFTLFMKNVPHEVSAINQSYELQQYKQLASQLHKLHGALCYCGLPRLKTLVARMEMNIKNNHLEELKGHMDLLNDEVKSVMSV